MPRRIRISPLGALLDGLARVPAGAAEARIVGIASDSRLVQPGFLFAALPGARADGADFIADAAARGAAAVLARPGTAAPIPVATCADPRLALARIAARWHGRQPSVAAAVTGTNGKTSTAAFLRALWAAQGRRAASLGTLGLIAPGLAPRPTLTTPDPIALHALLAELADAEIDHLALEASSHGLDQRRLDGVDLAAAAYTNLTRDHLDYHGSMEAYAAAKARLFLELLPRGAAAVLDVDDPAPAALAAACARRGLRVWRIGAGPEAEIRVLASVPRADGRSLSLEVLGRPHRVELGLVGGFQARNALAAIGLALACGADVEPTLAAAARLEGVRGRLELAATTPAGARIYVDYAHTPDALATMLAALRPHVAGRLIVVFGCGGDRDPGKRPLMAAAACAGADHAVLTDDNPRSEDPAAIRAAAATGCSGSWEEVAGRAAAIRRAVAAAGPGDVVVIAGKGHEQGQIIGATILPFDDAAEARAAALGRDAA